MSQKMWLVVFSTSSFFPETAYNIVNKLKTSPKKTPIMSMFHVHVASIFPMCFFWEAPGFFFGDTKNTWETTTKKNNKIGCFLWLPNPSGARIPARPRGLQLAMLQSTVANYPLNWGGEWNITSLDVPGRKCLDQRCLGSMDYDSRTCKSGILGL